MAAGDQVQIGTEWLLSFSGLVIVGYMPESWTPEYIYKGMEQIPGERKEAVSKIGTDPGWLMTGSLFVKADYSEYPEQHSWVAIKAPGELAAKYYYVEKCTPSYSNGITKLSIQVFLPDSQTDGATIGDSTLDYNITTNANLVGTLDFNSATVITGIQTSAGVALDVTDDYTIAGVTLTLIGDGYLQTALTVAGQTLILVVSFDLGAPIFLTITAVES